MAEISDFVVIDDNNTARWPEGMPFSSVNNAARADEGLLARWFKDINGSLVTAGTATAYTLTPNRTVPALYVGLHFKLQFNVDCGANPTLTLPTLAAVNLVREGNTGLNALDVRAGPIYDVVYNGTGFQVTNIPFGPATLRRTENDTTLRKVLSIQSGSGAGNDFSINETGGGANNVVTITEQIGATVTRAFTTTSQQFPLPFDLTEIATPAVPGAGLFRLYAKTGGKLAFREGAAGPETFLSPVALPGAQSLSIANNGTTPNTQIDISVAQAILTTAAGIPIFWQAGGTVTVDLTVNGVNGLDTGAKAINTWYNLYLISDGTNFRGLASLSATAPTLPANYIYFMRVGAMQTDGSGNLLRTQQIGADAEYIPVTGTNTVSYPNIPVTGTQADINVSSFFPPTAARARLIGTFVSGATTAARDAYAFGVNPNARITDNRQNTAPIDMLLTRTNPNTINLLGGTWQAFGWRDRVNAT